MRRKKATTTANIAPFQSKLGQGVLRRPKPYCITAEEWENGKTHCRRFAKTKKCRFCGRVEESVDRADSRIGPYTFAKPKPYDHPLNDILGGDSTNAPEITDKYDPNDDPEKIRQAMKDVEDRNKEAQLDEGFEDYEITNILNDLKSTDLAKLFANAKYIGKGTKGVAFDIGNGKIAKVTKDESEAEASSIIQGKKLQGLWKVFDVYKYKGPVRLLKNVPYVIIGEKLKENDSKARKIVKELDSFWSDVLEVYSISPSTYRNELGGLVLKYYDDEAKEQLSSDAYNIFRGLVNLQELNIQFGDIDDGNNILFSGSKPVITDLGYSKSKGTVSHTYESTTVAGVAGTDTRFGGPSFEPVFFSDHYQKNDAIRNEKVFYKNSNSPVLLPGWEYVSDYAQRSTKEIRTRVNLADLRFSQEEEEAEEINPDNIQSNPLDQGEDKNVGISRKMRTGIAWELAGPDKVYQKLLKRLKKAHNI